MGWIILIIVIALIILVISLYNGLVSSRVKVDNAWSQIDVQLQRRFDLIPNFVETVKGYASHESETFEKIAQLRTSWANAGTVAEKAELDNQLSGALKTIMAVSESYPELKANENFNKLQDQLQRLEEEIAGSRRYYNGVVNRYNTKTELFPGNIIAGIFGFKRKPLFEVSNESERENVQVKF